MQYVRLGNTGMTVSRICLGCMTYGIPDRGSHPWTLDEAQSRPFIKRALEMGITFFDTANTYSDGTSEEILGRAIRDFADREGVVIATKVFSPLNAQDKDPNHRGLSRKAIFRAVDESLRRLGMEYIDLYQTHRWDYNTPIEETMEALHDLVKSGKVRYIGGSSMYAWQFAKANHVAEMHGWTKFVSMQNYYNVMYREEEREMLPYCADQGIAVIPWSPLARGKLARDFDESTIRQELDEAGKRMFAGLGDADRAIIERVREVAEKRGVPRAQVALAWLLGKPVVTAPIVGASKPHHLEDAVAALDIVLTPEEVAYLEEPYIPHPIHGHN